MLAVAARMQRACQPARWGAYVRHVRVSLRQWPVARRWVVAGLVGSLCSR
jgi:hypothetical protein